MFPADGPSCKETLTYLRRHTPAGVCHGQKQEPSLRVSPTLYRNRSSRRNLWNGILDKIIESVEGVENSIVVLNDDPELKLIKPRSEACVIYLDASKGSLLDVRAEDYIA